VIGTLGFQTRPVEEVLEEVLEEIDALRANGIHEIFFMDQTFGVIRSRGLELCEALQERGDLSWTAYTRPDTGDEVLLSAMKAAGCHTIMRGVESADDELLAAYEKGYKSSIILDAFRRAKNIGLRTVGTFIIGLPQETKSSLEQTLELAVRMDMDFMSLNMAVPRFGTPFRKQALELGLASENDLVMDQGGADAFLPTSTLDRKTMLAMKKRMVRSFYLRPSYLWNRLKSVSSFYELKAHLREGWALLSRNV
jgi:anaerobic magnesium-protoporphyrin IX monomethyl ester cyclase